MKRLLVIQKHLTESNSLTITDNRTGKVYEIPIEKSYIKAMELKKIVSGDEGLKVYDQG